MRNKLNKRLEKERNELIKIAFENGMIAQDLATILNMSIQRVYQILKKERELKEQLNN